LTTSRHAFDDELAELEQSLIEMASRAEAMVADAVDSLVRLDGELAMRVIKEDDNIDSRDLEIEQHCLRILALQQPMAHDLRIVGTVMKVITDVERIGDLAVDIAKISLKVAAEMGSASAIDIRRIANLARQMVRESIEAYVKRDLGQVQRVCDMDDQVDSVYREYRGQLHEVMRANPDRVVEASWLLLAIHHIERVADHATNIAERVHFMETGKLEHLATSHRSEH
jgi:phosphate transport system protein